MQLLMRSEGSGPRAAGTDESRAVEGSLSLSPSSAWQLERETNVLSRCAVMREEVPGSVLGQVRYS
jgi:mevalonate pyrophosphate decarboxylase